MFKPTFIAKLVTDLYQKHARSIAVEAFATIHHNAYLKILQNPDDYPRSGVMSFFPTSVPNHAATIEVDKAPADGGAGGSAAGAAATSAPATRNLLCSDLSQYLLELGMPATAAVGGAAAAGNAAAAAAAEETELPEDVAAAAGEVSQSPTAPPPTSFNAQLERPPT
jgi:hypothetical protein